MHPIIAKIHQGKYDTEKELLNLRKNAIKSKNHHVLDATEMRLKKAYPKLYQRLIGPLYVRSRDKRFNCYCNHPQSLHQVYLDIISESVPHDALTCDACWQEDLTTTWGYYGWATKQIPSKKWKELCDARGYDKFGTQNPFLNFLG